MQEETGKEWKPAAQAAPASKPAEKKVPTDFLKLAGYRIFRIYR
jgi:hypothetical protein